MSNENRTTALVEGETLSYQRDGEHYQLQVGTPVWYAWLRTATSFHVRGPLEPLLFAESRRTISAVTVTGA